MARTAHPWYYAQTKSWMAYVDGRKIRLVKGPKDTTTRRQARQVLDNLLEQKAANPNPQASEPTVASIIETYLKSAKYAERSRYERIHYFQLFAEHCGWKLVRECIPFDLTSFLDANPQWRSDWTISQVINIVQRPFNWASKQRLIKENPFRGIAHGRGQPRRPMSAAEFLGLVRATRNSHGKKRPTSGARFRQVLYFLWYTGSRPGEASKMRWADIDLDEGIIRLWVHKTTRTQRVKVPRIIPLDGFLVRLLAKVRRQDDPGEYVFLTHRKTPWNRCNLSLRVQRAREVAGIPDDATLYGIRHGFGTRSIFNGVDLKTLSQLMGHTTTRMTEHYVHLAGQHAHLAAAMRRANGHHRDG